MSNIALNSLLSEIMAHYIYVLYIVYTSDLGIDIPWNLKNTDRRLGVKCLGHSMAFQLELTYSICQFYSALNHTKAKNKLTMRSGPMDLNRRFRLLLGSISSRKISPNWA